MTRPPAAEQEPRTLIRDSIALLRHFINDCGGPIAARLHDALDVASSQPVEAEAAQPTPAGSDLYVTVRDAISAHIEREAERIGTYHGDPAATPGGTGYCIPAAVATQIVDKYLLEYLTRATRSDRTAGPNGTALWIASDLIALLEELPSGVYDGAHRYDTDDEHVLHVWRDGQSCDIRWPRVAQL